MIAQCDEDGTGRDGTGRDGMGWDEETGSEGQRQVRGLTPEDDHFGALGTRLGTMEHGEELAVHYLS